MGWLVIENNFVIKGPCHKFISKICFMCEFLDLDHVIDVVPKKFVGSV
jgi:hypothetical protein